MHLISQSMHVPGSTNVHLRMHRLTQDDPDEEEEENDESWTTTPAVLKMTSGIQMLTLLVSRDITPLKGVNVLSRDFGKNNNFDVENTNILGFY